MRLRCSTVLVLMSSALLVVLAGCGAGSLSNTVDSDLLKEMSRQGELWVYDAENEIVVALDRLDEAKDQRRGIKVRLREAEKNLEAAEKRNARLGVEMAEAWINHLEGLEDWTEANIENLEFGIVVAMAAVELAKAQVINREDLLGGKGFAVKDYQVQYTKLKKEFDREKKRVQKVRKKARKLENKWWTLRRRFIAQTGDYDRGLWIE